MIGRRHLCSGRLRDVSAPAPKSRGGVESGHAAEIGAGSVKARPAAQVPAPKRGGVLAAIDTRPAGQEVGVTPDPRDVPMMDRDAARYIVQTHPITQQADEKPEDFVLRIVRAYDHVKGGLTRRAKPKGRPLEKDRSGSLEATRPWEAEGMSRRTWFRRKGKS